jgi:AGCS family alanine or glycine:cation symporter
LPAAKREVMLRASPIVESIEHLVAHVSGFVWSWGVPVGDQTIPAIVIALLGTGLFLTLRLSFVQLRRFAHGVAVTSGKYDDPEHPGDVSHFQALSTALSATVGIGNIAGVAIALHFGGPGALFWMWLTAFLGMATKYAEVTLAQRYRVVDDADASGTVAGGPMYYIERGLGPRWKPLAILFAVALGVTAFLTGNGVQANTMADTALTAFGVPGWITGLVTATLVAGTVLGGIRRIGRVAAILAPAMAVIYVVGGVSIMLLHIEAVVPALMLVFTEAFSPSAGIAGTGMGALLVTMMWGVKRGLFSNEAGQGSAPIAHAAAKTNEPVSEGVVALLEPFIDTIVICTMTALVILMTGTWKERVPSELALGTGGDLSWVQADGGQVDAPPQRVDVQAGRVVEGPQLGWHDVAVDTLYVDEAQTIAFTGTIEVARGVAIPADGGTARKKLYGDAVESGAPLTMLAFQRGLSALGSFGHHVVLVSVFLFGLSTAISWSYYGDRCAHYVFGPKAVLPYRAVYVLMHFLGAVVPLSLAWQLGDVLLGIVILPNLAALILLSPQVVEMTRSYFQRKPWRKRA